MFRRNWVSQQLRSLDKSSPQFHEQLTNFFHGDEYQKAFPRLESESLTWLVEYLDNLLVDVSNHAGPIFQEPLRELIKICGVKQVLPESCTLSESLLGSVYQGTFNGSKVRVRRVKANPRGDKKKVNEIFHRVAVMSRRLAHPNIVTLLGATLEPLELISDWMPGGDLPEYTTNHPDADRISPLSDVAEGLSYLHSCNVIHGNLNGSSILMDATGHARITDFGLAMVNHDLDSIWGASTERGHSTRWIAPEILTNQGTYSKEADVFSFAGVAIEVLSGAAPFSDKSPYKAMQGIVQGERPPRPIHPGLTEGLWELIQQCWGPTVQQRPRALRISCHFGPPAWKRLIDRSPTLEERISLITEIFFDRDETEIVKRLSGDDAQSFVDAVDQTLDNLEPQLRKKSLSILSKICGRQALLPKSLQIPICYNRADEPLCSGGYADVWKGEYQGRKVAVKVLRVYRTSNLDKITAMFCKEVVTWRGLHHLNVLPLLGVTMNGKTFAMVSEWMDNGTINEFIKTNRDTNRFDLLKGVATGLIYMHSQGMIHGDLKGANIMVDKNSEVCLVDFGLLTFVSDPSTTTHLSSITNAGTTRWMSPELLHPEEFGYKQSRPTTESDCYALGMVILEVLGEEPPFVGDKDVVVMQKVIEGKRPKRPEGAWFTDTLWRTMEQCWAPQPNDRPTVEAVLECLGQVSTAWQPLPPIVERVETRSDVSVSITSHDTSESIPDPPISGNQLGVGTPHDQTHFIPDCYDESDNPFHRGQYADMWVGEHQGRQVAVKVLKLHTIRDVESIKSRFCEEVMTWKSLNHPNLLTPLGVTMNGKRLGLVSEWMVNGSVNEFVKFNPGADRFELLKGVTRGLIYMHSQGMMHGDLKGDNVMVDENGQARLADFALLTFVSSPFYPAISKPFTGYGLVRWRSPELLNSRMFRSGDIQPTKKSDCYALGMVMLEVLSGEPPFARDTDIIIQHKITQGERPERPREAQFSDALWRIVERCWSPQPNDRPTAKAVLECLGQPSNVWQQFHDESTSTTSHGVPELVPDPSTRSKRLGIGEPHHRPPNTRKVTRGRNFGRK